MHLLMDPPADAVVTPPTFIAFDCLYSRGRDIRSWPLKDRRKLMEDEIDGSPVLPARRLPDDGLEAWELVQARGCEGLIAKDAMAPYGPSTRWWKIKVRHEARVLVGRVVVMPEGYHGLLVGARVGRNLRYLGTVEWGVGRRTSKQWRRVGGGGRTRGSRISVGGVAWSGWSRADGRGDVL